MPQDRIVFLIPSEDGELADFLRAKSWQVFPGDGEDVQSRFVMAGRQWQADVILRLTGDNPFPDTLAIESIIDTWILGYRTNRIPDLIYMSPLPLGMGIESFSYRALEKCLCFDEPRHKEHVSLAIKENPEQYSILKIPSGHPPEVSHLRITLDEPGDYQVLQNTSRQLLRIDPKDKSTPGLPHYQNATEWNALDILRLSRLQPSLFQANQNVKQVRFPLPPHPPTKSQLQILVGDPEVFGTGHRERMGFLAHDLVLDGHGVEVFPIANQQELDSALELDFPIRIVDSRDMVASNPQQTNLIYIDNFHPLRDQTTDQNHYQPPILHRPTFLDILPHPRSSQWTQKPRLLTSQYFQSQPKTPGNGSILIYTGSLKDEWVENLESRIHTSFPQAPVLRIGTAPKAIFPVRNRLTKLEWYQAICHSSFFLSYFGQGLWEAVHLGKAVATYSMTTDHHNLSQYALEEWGIPYLCRLDTTNSASGIRDCFPEPSRSFAHVECNISLDEIPKLVKTCY